MNSKDHRSVQSGHHRGPVVEDIDPTSFIVQLFIIIPVEILRRHVSVTDCQFTDDV